jgi:hypothetical protein
VIEEITIELECRELCVVAEFEEMYGYRGPVYVRPMQEVMWLYQYQHWYYNNKEEGGLSREHFLFSAKDLMESLSHRGWEDEYSDAYKDFYKVTYGRRFGNNC